MKPSIVPAFSTPATDPESHATALPVPRPGRGLQDWARRLLLGQLEGLRSGRLRIVAAEGSWEFGESGPSPALTATIEVIDPQFWADTAFGGTVGAGEAYIRGRWHCSDLTALVRIMVVNRELMNRLEGGWSIVTAPLRRLLHWTHRNTRRGSERNIAAHYDLGNELFSLFLDETMAYSCAVFPTATTTLHAASLAKFEMICRKLDLRPGEHLLEIGTGWGGLALYAAQHYGCRVTTTTISREQHDFAAERIRAAGLGDRVTLLLEDYRELRGRHDKLVSVEMIEAVGHRYLDTYFDCCSRLLAPHGAMLLQAITLQDQFYETALKSVDFIQRFIFPGSFIPSITAMLDAVRRSTDMKLFDLEDIGPHYATTLRCWRERFMARTAEVRALGYPEEFVRMWEYYLSYCEGGYLERQLGDVQMLLTKPQCRRAVLSQS